MYACPGLGEKMPAVRFDVEFSSSDREPPEWGGEVECQCLSYERNPFNGKPFFNEVSFSRLWQEHQTYLDPGCSLVLAGRVPPQAVPHHHRERFVLEL